MDGYRISQLAERSGVPATTLRFYDGAGLLPAERTPTGYRVYDDTAVDRLTFITSAKLLGLSLDDIADLLDVREDGVCAPVRARLRALVAERIADADRQLAELAAFSASLRAAEHDLRGPAPDGACRADCGCTRDLVNPAAVSDVPPAGADDLGEPRRQAPVSCALAGTQMSVRAEQWRTLIDQCVAREQIPDGVRLTFPASGGLAAEIGALAAAEQECCPFFDITLRFLPSALALTVRAPLAASDLLAGLFGAAG